MNESIGQSNLLVEMILVGVLSPLIGGWFSFLWFWCFFLLWFCIKYYPSVVQTIVFWGTCLLGGISFVVRIMCLGSLNIKVPINLYLFGVMTLVYFAWKEAMEKDFLWEYLERRERIAGWEDFILWHGAMTLGINLGLFVFFLRGGTATIQGKVISINEILQCLHIS